MAGYEPLLLLHSWLRWVALLLLVVVSFRALRGWLGRRDFARLDQRLHVALMAAVDTQLLLGLSLYLVASPLVRAFLADSGHALRDSTLRFFGLEHPTMMLLGVVLLHLGRRFSKRAAPGPVRHRHVALWNGAAVLLLAAGIPWPFLPAGRPLFRTTPISTAVAASGATRAACPPLYFARCAACHGSVGHGDGVAASTLKPPPRDFTNGAWSAGTGDERLARVIRSGGALVGLSPAMPANADLPAAEIEGLVRCIRSFSQGTEELRP
jgi:mono/diheme cytochrome c family protein